jgi:hypothetical protein
VQVELSRLNELDLAAFIRKSREIDREYNLSSTQIVNSMLAEKLRQELKRLEKKKP